MEDVLVMIMDLTKVNGRKKIVSVPRKGELVSSKRGRRLTVKNVTHCFSRLTLDGDYESSMTPKIEVELH
jgi:hypothetical protein